MYDAELWNMNGPAVLTYAVNMYCDNPSKEPPEGDYFVALKCKNLEVKNNYSFIFIKHFIFLLVGRDFGPGSASRAVFPVSLSSQVGFTINDNTL